MLPKDADRNLGDSRSSSLGKENNGSTPCELAPLEPLKNGHCSEYFYIEC
jgi:hypothetical protein